VISDTELSEQKQRLLRELLRGNAAQHRAAEDEDRVKPRRPDEVAPLSAEQRDIWLHASMAPEVPLYNEAITIHRSGPFHLEALEQALNEILRRHEIWRTSFEQRDGSVYSRVHPDVRLVLAVVDLSHLAEAEREEVALAVATAEARKPFDLARPPLLRGTVVRLAPDAHRLYLTLHHLIFDGVSLYRVVMPELVALYDAFLLGRPCPLAEPRLQYGDYALWRERQLDSEPVQRALAYWRRLAGELPAPDLPTDRSPAPVLSHRGAMETFEFSPELTAALKELATNEGCTLYATLLAAFKALLHRYSGQEDIVIGGVTDMRSRPELHHLVGYFLNGVALRTHPLPQMAFRDYLAEVQLSVVEALDACSAPLDAVVREVRPRRHRGRHPLFQVLFSIQPPAGAVAEGWALTQMDVTVGTAKFDLYLELEEMADRIIGRFIYSTDLFDASTIRRMIGHWTTLLDGAADDPQCRLAALPLLTADERRQLLIDRNATRQAYPDTTLHGWFEAQAHRTPEAIAVEGDGVSWRYRDLLRRVGVMAAYLQEAGVGCETLVGIAMPRSPAMVAGLLAILRAGGAYLPLDPDLPMARLALLIGDARPSFILTEPSVVSRLPQSPARLILYDDGLDSSSDESRECDVGPRNLAYVLYTSGSTGRPKAVEIEHRSVVNLLHALQRDLRLDGSDALLAVTTLSFDIAALELFLPLVTGARLVIATREEATDPSRLAQVLQHCGCTIMQATPATWRGLIACGWLGNDRLKILCGGEALQRDLAAALRERAGMVWNMYGPTETTIWSLSHEVSRADDPVPIGTPLANTRVYVLDRNGAAVPAGVAGELFIAGDGVARGYRNDAALTGASFVTVPAVPESRLYRTGDIVKHLADGPIEFVGRADNQVKIRGFRVGLEEVEAALVSHPDISAAAVRATDDASGELSLVAFVVGHQLDDPQLDDPQLNGAEIRQFLRQRLPDYMVPTRTIVLPALPTMPNGKVDRKGLPAVTTSQARDGGAPHDALERQLAAIWQDLFKGQEIGIHENFFDVGGHSLLAVILLARIKEVVGRELPLIALFNAPTIAGLAQALRANAGPTFSYLVPLRPEGTGRPLFIVHGIFGNVLQLAALARRVDTDRPIHAIQARGADLLQEPHASIAEMVEAYVDAIRKRQPDGPYALAGYSFGGLVAFEMARRLRELGEEVELLALFETDLHERYLPLLKAIAYQWTLARRVLAKSARLSWRELPAYLWAKLCQFSRKLLVRAHLSDYPVAIDEAAGPLSDRFYLMFQMGAREFMAFNPKPYDRTISLFRVTVPRYDACDPLPIWRRAAKSVVVYDIAGDHDTIMYEPHVQSLATQLSQCLATLKPGD
jgi:amino acid adenylation domain-containing protein